MSSFTTPLTKEICVYSYFKRRSWLGRLLGLSQLRHRLVDNGLCRVSDWRLSVALCLPWASCWPPGRGLWILGGYDAEHDPIWRRPTAGEIECVLNGYANDEDWILPPIRHKRPYLSVILKHDVATAGNARLARCN